MGLTEANSFVRECGQPRIYKSLCFKENALKNNLSVSQITQIVLTSYLLFTTILFMQICDFYSRILFPFKLGKHDFKISKLNTQGF